MVAISSKEKKVTARDGTNLYCRVDNPEDARAVVVIVHGFCEHLGRYEYLTERLTSEGYAVYRFDNRGHGKSGGRRGDLEDFHDLIDDAALVVELAKEENPELPVFLLGHSMGGFIAAAYGVKYPGKLQGQILSGAALLEPNQVKGIKAGLLGVLNTIAPGVNIKNSLSKLVCRDQNVVRDYEQDPLNLKRATVRFHVEFLIKGIQWLKDRASSYQYPCLILHGGDDRLVNKKASQHFYNTIASEDKALKIYEGLYHEIFNENEKDAVIQDVLNWIEERL